MSDLTKRVENWEALFASPAWKELEEIMQQQLRARADVILKEPLTQDTIFEREVLRGERNGIELVFSVAETVLEQARIDVERAVKENQDVRQDV